MKERTECSKASRDFQGVTNFGSFAAETTVGENGKKVKRENAFAEEARVPRTPAREPKHARRQGTQRKGNGIRAAACSREQLSTQGCDCGSGARLAGILLGWGGC